MTEPLYYLVLGRCGTDDVPLKLCRTLAGAKKYASVVTCDQVAEIARRIMGAGLSTICGVSIVPFDDLGFPQAAIYFKDLAHDADCEADPCDLADDPDQKRADDLRGFSKDS